MCEEIPNSNDNIINNKNITIRILSNETLKVISTLLNPIKYISSEKGVPRDWHGLAQLCNISGEKMPNIQQSDDPSNKVLELWVNHNKDESTIDKLLSFLELMDRFDVVYDITHLIEKDIEYYKQHPNGFNIDYPYIDDRDILTIDDFDRKSRGLSPQIYDAFVLFADDDIDFATELIQTMENQYNLKLCVKDRDLVGGVIEHDTVVQLISKRCGRLVVIISQSFFESPVRKYLFSVAQVEGIENRRRKIIPCLIKPCDNVPPDFRLYVILDHSKKGVFYDFWEKLYRSIKPVESPNGLTENQVFNRSMETLKPKHRQHVKFNSMGNLHVDESPLENNTTTLQIASSQIASPEEKEPLSPSDVNNLESEAPKVTLVKKNALLEEMKRLIPKFIKSSNLESNDTKTSEIKVVKNKSKKKTLKKLFKAKIAVAN